MTFLFIGLCLFCLWFSEKQGEDIEKAQKKLTSYIVTLELTQIECQKICGECIICLQDFTTKDVVMYTHCGHFYHLICLKEWMDIKKICPICSSTL